MITNSGGKCKFPHAILAFFIGFPLQELLTSHILGSSFQEFSMIHRTLRTWWIKRFRNTILLLDLYNTILLLIWFIYINSLILIGIRLLIFTHQNPILFSWAYRCCLEQLPSFLSSYQLLLQVGSVDDIRLKVILCWVYALHVRLCQFQFFDLARLIMFWLYLLSGA